MTVPTPPPLICSVSGIRGIAHETFTEDVIADFARAWAVRSIENSQGSDVPIMVLGRDGRRGGEVFAAAAAAAMESCGVRVVDLGVATTPTIGVMVTALQGAGGLVITASHNPQEWNGVKAIDGTGAAPPPHVAAALMASFRGGDIPPVSTETGGIERESRGIDTHVAKVLGAVDPGPIINAHLSVVADSVNSSGGPAIARLLEALGCTIHQLHGGSSGVFPHHPEPVRENLVELAAAVGESGGIVGLAQDPDADRLAVVDETGRYIGEEYTIALATMAVLRRAPKGASVVANLSTSRMVDDVAARFGASVHRSAVGEANVVEEMRRCGAIIGGEGNGGVILPRVGWVRDSLIATALVLDLIVSMNQPLSVIVDEIPRYSILKTTLDLSAIGGLDAVAAAAARIKSHYPVDQVNDSDGIRVDTDTGWVHLRPSNTEPIARVIAEAADGEAAESLIEEILTIGGMSRGM